MGVYIRTVCRGNITCTPIEHVEIEHVEIGNDPLFAIRVVDEMEMDGDDRHFHIFPERVQICIEIDGDLYVWKEWEDLYGMGT